MARTKGKKGSKQTALTGSGFWPMLSKPAIAIGKHASVPGKYWNGCPAADKEKRFMCIVVEFTAMHDFGDGVKGAGFKLKEMGEDGRGSLEPADYKSNTMSFSNSRPNTQSTQNSIHDYE